MAGGPPLLQMTELGCLNSTEEEIAKANPPFGYCQSSQPDWSALRDPSFGHAIIEVLSDSEMTLSWYVIQYGPEYLHRRMYITSSLSYIQFVL